MWSCHWNQKQKDIKTKMRLVENGEILCWQCSFCNLNLNKNLFICITRQSVRSCAIRTWIQNRCLGTLKPDVENLETRCWEPWNWMLRTLKLDVENLETGCWEPWNRMLRRLEPESETHSVVGLKSSQNFLLGTPKLSSLKWLQLKSWIFSADFSHVLKEDTKMLTFVFTLFGTFSRIENVLEHIISSFMINTEQWPNAKADDPIKCWSNPSSCLNI